MSCYLRHLKPMFEHMSMDYRDKTQRKIVDSNIRTLLGMEDKTCSEIWAKIKEIGKDDKAFWGKVEKVIKR